MRIWSLLLLLLLSITAVLAADGPITFKFAPVVGTIYDQQETRKGTLTVMGKEIALFQKTVISFKLGKDGGNYLFAGTPTGAQATRNGQPYMDDFLALLKGLTITDVVNPRGDVIDITGDDTLRANAKEKLSPEMNAAIEKVINHEALLKQDKAIFASKVTRLIGRPVKIGDTWIDTFNDPVSALNEEMPVYRYTRIDGWAKAGERKVLRVKIICNSTAEGLAMAIEKTAKDVTGAVEKPLDEGTDGKLSSSGETLIDPATMCIYSETGSLDVLMVKKVAATRTVAITFTEKNETTYTYR